MLLQRPADPIEAMAEYFRTAAALESLSTPSSASSIGSFSPTFLPSGSTPFTRALFLLQSTSTDDDEEEFLLSVHDRIASAFEELASLSFDNGGLLGSLLLAKPKQPTRSGPSLATSAVTVTSGKDKQTTESTGEVAAGVDSSDLRLLLTRLFSAPSAASASAVAPAAADWIPLPTDLQQLLLSGLMEAASDSAPVAAPASASSRPVAPTSSASLIGFAGFSRAVLAQRQLSSLYAHLASLMLALSPPPAHLRSTDAKLMHLQTSSIRLEELQELVRLIVQRSKQSTAKRGLSEAQVAMLVAAVQSLSAPSTNPGSSSARSAPPSSVSLMSFIRAVLQGSLSELARARGVRRADSARHLAWKQSGSPAVSSTSPTPFSPQPFTPALASVYASAFHHNPAQAGLACSEESTETVEYKS